MTIPEYENHAPWVEVFYMCEKKHVSPIKFHAQVKDFPKTWDCTTCHNKAKYVASASTPTEEYVPDPKKLSAELRSDDDDSPEEEEKTVGGAGRFTHSHLQALHERRTEEQLQKLLNERLAILRASRASK